MTFLVFLFEIASFISECCAGEGYIAEAAKAVSQWVIDYRNMQYIFFPVNGEISKIYQNPLDNFDLHL